MGIPYVTNLVVLKSVINLANYIIKTTVIYCCFANLTYIFQLVDIETIVIVLLRGNLLYEKMIFPRCVWQLLKIIVSYEFIIHSLLAARNFQISVNYLV